MEEYETFKLVRRCRDGDLRSLVLQNSLLTTRYIPGVFATSPMQNQGLLCFRTEGYARAWVEQIRICAAVELWQAVARCPEPDTLLIGYVAVEVTQSIKLLKDELRRRGESLVSGPFGSVAYREVKLTERIASWHVTYSSASLIDDRRQ